MNQFDDTAENASLTTFPNSQFWACKCWFIMLKRVHRVEAFLVKLVSKQVSLNLFSSTCKSLILKLCNCQWHSFIKSNQR